MAVAASVASLLAAVALSAGAGDEIVVTRESPTLPSGCTPREAAELLVRFAEAVSRGERKALARVFAVEEGDHFIWRPAPYFRWYSVTEARDGVRWRHTAIYDIADLFPYFADRARQNERWQVIGLEVGPSSIPGAAGITYLIRREADDLPASVSRMAHGKGEIDCASQRIFVWSMAQDDSVNAPPCPLPEGWKVGDSIVACARTGTTGTGVNARAVLPDFRVVAGRVRAPVRCAPRSVAARVRAVLTAFNAGKGVAFARHFTRDGYFVPYGTGRTGRGAIARLVEERYAAGDGWTAAALKFDSVMRAESAPRAAPARAVYRLDLLLAARGQPLRHGGAKFVVTCRSGLISKWVGPSGAS